MNISAVLQTDGSLLASRIVVQGPKDGDAKVEGAIETLGASSFSVKGTKVTVDSKTEIRSKDKILAFKDLKVGDRVHVSGAKQADNSVLATRIEVVGR